MDAGEKAPLCIAGTLQAIVLSGCGRAFHINSAVCTGLFPLSVGVVGNLGLFTQLTARFSKSPHLHRSVLENPPLTQATLLEPLHLSFHFSSSNDGYYYLFSLFFYVFPNTRRCAIPDAHDQPSRYLMCLPRGMNAHSKKPPESREVPLFSTRILTQR
jgi:hypothetical protein